MLGFVLMLVALILFILAAVPFSSPPKWNLVAMGLAFMAGSFVLGLYPG